MANWLNDNNLKFQKEGIKVTSQEKKKDEENKETDHVANDYQSESIEIESPGWILHLNNSERHIVLIVTRN